MAVVLAEGYLGNKRDFTVDPWPELYQALREKQIFQETVVGVEPYEDGQALVLRFGTIKGIVPPKEIGDEALRNPALLVGTVVAVRVKHCDRANKIVYLSRGEALKEMARATLESFRKEAAEVIELQEQLAPIREALSTANSEGNRDKAVKLRQKLNAVQNQAKEVGPTRTCTVRFVTEIGAFADIGGILALIPNRELSHAYVADAREVVIPGESFDVKIYEVDLSDSDNPRVQASLRALLPDPWDDIKDRYTENGIYLARVANRELKRGFMVQLEPGILAYAAEVGYGNPAPGTKVQYRIDRLLPERHRIYGSIIRILDNAYGPAR